MNLAELLTVYQAQGDFFKTKETLDVSFRLKGLDQLEKLLRTNETKLLEALRQDLGKHPDESYLTELGLIYQSISLAKKNLTKWSKPQKVKTPLYLWPARSRIQAVPYGQTLIISPFNYPLLLSFDPLVGALAAGNVCLVALSEFTPKLNHVLLAVMGEYFPANYLYFFVSEPELNASLLQEKFAKIFFTGSPRVGKIVAQAASRHLTPITLELGGKSPALVTETAELPLAVERIVWGKFLNAGQTCVAPDYCLVPASQVEEFISLAKKKVNDFFGDVPESSADYGRIVSQHHLNRLEKLLIADEAYVLEKLDIDEENRYLGPTLLVTDLAAVTAGQVETMKEEIFGPILPIISYDSLDEALNFITLQAPPLAFYPFSRDKKLVQRLLLEIPFGGATVNDTVLHLSNHHLPFGGMGESGMGSYHGKKSFTTFSHEKSILWRSYFLPLKIMQPPYNEFKAKLIKFFLK